MRTAAAEVAAARGVTATRVVTSASARSVTSAAARSVTSAAAVTAAATATAVTATAAVLREGGRGADQYRRQNAGCQKNALGPNTHDSHLRLPVAPLHGHLERIK
jgi:hypothetical protein